MNKGVEKQSQWENWLFVNDIKEVDFLQFEEKVCQGKGNKTYKFQTFTINAGEETMLYCYRFFPVQGRWDFKRFETFETAKENLIKTINNLKS